MNIINTIDDRKFSLNGISYLKNYVSVVHGQNIEIFNCYERQDVLVGQAAYSQFKVNNVVYTSAAALQNALINVIYSRNTLGGDVNDQDNIVITKSFVYQSGDTIADVVQTLNNLPAYNVGPKNLVLFKGRQRSTIFVPGGGISFASNSLTYLLKGKGKGLYGLGGEQITATNLELLERTKTDSSVAESDPETDIINFGDISSLTVVGWLNSQDPAKEIQPQDEGYTLFKGTIDGEAVSYLWVGEAGTYGAGETQSTAADFQILDEALPGAGVLTVTGDLVDTTNPANPVIHEKKDLPYDFYIGCNPSAPKVTYLTDVYRELDFSDVLPEINKQMINEVVRDNDKPNNIFLTGNFYTNPGFILILQDCHIINNILKFTLSGGELPFNEIHGLVYHNGYLYGSNRPNPDILTASHKIFKINPYDLSDVKVLAFPIDSPFQSGATTDIKVYGDKLYCLYGGNQASSYFIEIDDDLNDFRILFVCGTNGAKRVSSQSDYVIHRDKIYIPTYYNFSGTLRFNSIGIQVYDFSGNLVQENLDIIISTDGITTPYVHWATIVNDKLIFSLARYNGHKKLVRFNLRDLMLDGNNSILSLPNSVTDDNTVFSDGYMYLNEERTQTEPETVICRLIKVKYNDFNDLTVEIPVYNNGVGCHGSINPIIQKSSLNKKTSQLQNNGDGLSPFATQQWVTTTLGPTIYPEINYSQLLSWSGTTPPSGTLTANWQAIKSGNVVTLRMNMLYTVAGSALTSLSMPLPSGAPIPAIPSGFNTSNYYICAGAGNVFTSPTGSPSNATVSLRREGSSSSFSVKLSFTSGAVIGAYFTITYLTP